MVYTAPGPDDGETDMEPQENVDIAKLRSQAATFAKTHNMPHHPGDIIPSTDGEPDMEPLGDMLFTPPKKGKPK